MFHSNLSNNYEGDELILHITKGWGTCTNKSLHLSPGEHDPQNYKTHHAGGKESANHLKNTLFKEMGRKNTPPTLTKSWVMPNGVIKAYPDNRRGVASITSESKQKAK